MLFSFGYSHLFILVLFNKWAVIYQSSRVKLLKIQIINFPYPPSSIGGILYLHLLLLPALHTEWLDFNRQVTYSIASFYLFTLTLFHVKFLFWNFQYLYNFRITYAYHLWIVVAIAQGRSVLPLMASPALHCSDFQLRERFLPLKITKTHFIT